MYLISLTKAISSSTKGEARYESANIPGVLYSHQKRQVEEMFNAFGEERCQTLLH